MICCFCEAHLDTLAEAIEADWVPDFWVGEVSYEGPVCSPCQRHLACDDDGEMYLRDGVPCPPLAIPLRVHPNKKGAQP